MKLPKILLSLFVGSLLLLGILFGYFAMTSLPTQQFPAQQQTAQQLPASEQAGPRDPAQAAVANAPQTQHSQTLIYEIDYTRVPPLSFRDLTLNIDVGRIDAASVTAGGLPVPHLYSAADGTLRITVDRSPVEITLRNMAGATASGQLQKATLRDNKAWAWSLGFDDNVELKPTLAVLDSYGYKGTIYQIAELVEEQRNKEWIIDRPDMITYLNTGWSIGNHTWDHDCSDIDNKTDTITKGYDRMVQVARESSRTEYQVIGFAAPCFNPLYQPYILSMRDSNMSAVQFNESGAGLPLMVDADRTSDLTVDGRTLHDFHFDRAIGRDSRVAWDPQAAIKEIDWLAALVSPTLHLWYNSMAHGNNEESIKQVVDYVYRTYGAGGKDEVWVAPADQIYSYLLVRDRSVVTLTENSHQSLSGLTPQRASNPVLNSVVDSIVESVVDTAASNRQSSQAASISVAPISVAGSSQSPVIEIANQSGVADYEIGIFGSGFGVQQGRGAVRILGVDSTILEWSDQFVRAVVPNVADGTGALTVVTDGGQALDAPFTVYTIEPSFLAEPSTTFRNISFGKPAYISNLDGHFCFRQPGNGATPPEQFLFDYACGFEGVTNVGAATFNAPATIAFEADAVLAGTYLLQYFSTSSWFEFEDVPVVYDIQASPDSTDGVDGTWTTLDTITDNTRASRLHQIDVPAAAHKWLRLNVQQGSGTDGRFKLKEIRVYQPAGSLSALSDSFAIYGDSLTASAFEAIGPTGLSTALKELRNTPTDPLLSVYGLSGQNTTGLLDDPDKRVDIYDAFALDAMATRASHWGIALGTNDSADGGALIGVNGSNIEEYDNRVDAIVQELIARGRVPLLARIPDTIESMGGFGDFEAKKKILADIDAVAARYRLIPGPDFYTAFRRNIEEENGSYFGNDGTHHTSAGQQALIKLWAKALLKRPTIPDPTPTAFSTPTSTATPTATSIITPTDTPVPKATATASPSSTPTQVSTPTPTLAPTFTPAFAQSATPTKTATTTPNSTPTPSATSTIPPTQPIDPTAAATATATPRATISAQTPQPTAVGLHHVYISYFGNASTE